jgi:peptide/nickel transport system substrate-binding protein
MQLKTAKAGPLRICLAVICINPYLALGQNHVQFGAGRYGGSLVISERSEPKTLNPLTALEASSRDMIGLLDADLIHINRKTQETEPALAESWSVSADRRRYTLRLLHGVRFSDGQPFDADDVVFSFRSYLDERVHSPQRDMLIVGGKPIAVEKIDQYTVAFTLSEAYAAAERLFDGVAMLPRHLLARDFEQGSLGGVWPVSVAREKIAGLGAFRLKEYVPGQRIVLERNPYYWKKDAAGGQLPYLSQIVCLFVANADVEALRFQAGDTDLINRLAVSDFAVLEREQRRRNYSLRDLGTGLEYDFLFFNENQPTASSPPGLAKKQAWFRQPAFRQAISSAIHRDDIVRLAFLGRADPLATQVAGGNKRWINPAIPPPVHSLERARSLLASCGLRRTKEGLLADAQGQTVSFSIAVNAGKAQQVQMATIIQHDLRDAGIEVTLDSVDSHTHYERIFSNYRYEAAILALAGGDADPNSEINVLSSQGGAHVWSLHPDHPPEGWQLEIDGLMQAQLVAPSNSERKRLYDRVQELVWENMPVIFLVSPHILVGAKNNVGNFKPAILSNYTLWNADELFFYR